MERNRKLVWQCCFLVAGLTFPALAAAQTAQLQAGNVSITVNRTDGSYVIGIKGQAASVLHSQVAAQIDRRWVRSNEYPRHEIRAEAFSDQLGPGDLLTITHTGEAAQSDLVCIVRAYSQRPFLNIEVQVRNRTTKDVTVQAIRSVEAIGTRMVYLGAEDSANRVLSDSYSEDRPEMVIYDLGKAPNGMHRAVGSQLIYNRRSGQSIFLGALTSERFLTIFHLQARSSETGSTVASFTADSTGTTEILKGESLQESPPEDQIELSLPVRPGESLASERLMIAVGPDYHAQLETYGATIRELHNPRVSAPTPMGWWSWTAYYFGLNQGTALTNARWLAEHLKSLGYDFFHVDEGYQYARGEYATPDAGLFPDGMRPLGDVVRHLGLTFGVWTAPFEVSERAWVYHNHPDWLVHNASGKPVHLGHVTENKDQLYALDPTNPGAQEYLRQTYATLVNDWGVHYIKMDFMDDSCVEGRYYRPNTTALEAQRIGLGVIREAVGNSVLLDKDGSPMLNPVGYVDAGRISVDTGHTFDASREAAPGIAARYYMNRNFYISDPDAFTVSRQTVSEHAWHGGERPLTLAEAQVSIVLSAVSGGMFEIGDDLPTLGADADRLALAQNRQLLQMVRLGRAAVPRDLMSYRVEDEMPSIFFLQEDRRQSMLAAFNWTNQQQSHTLRLADLNLPAAGQYQAFDVLAEGKTIPVQSGAISLPQQPPHSVRLVEIIDRSVPAAAPSITAEVPSAATVGQPVTFSAESDPNGVPALSYRWNFGDGVTGEGHKVTHAYTYAGDHTVRLLVDGVDNVPAEKSFHIAVTGSIGTLFSPATKGRFSLEKPK